MVLVKNWQCFHLLIVSECVSEYSRKKKRFLDHKNRKLKKSKNSEFSKGVSVWLWSKIGNFFIW